MKTELFDRTTLSAFLISCMFQVIFLPTAVEGQENTEIQPTGPLIRYELLKLIPDDPAKSRLDLNFNIPIDFFVFVRSESSPNDFVARGEISAEVLNARDLSVARDILRKEFRRSEPVSPRGKESRSVQGNFSFSLDPGAYQVIFEVNDLGSQRRYIDRSQQIVLKRSNDSVVTVSDILVLDHVESVNDSVTKVFPLNLGGDAVFGKNLSLLFQSTRGKGKSEPVHFTLYRMDITKRGVSILTDSISPVPSLVDHRLVPLDGDSILTYSLGPRKETLEVQTYVIDIRGDTLNWGQYDLEVKTKGGTVVRKSFTVRWLDMPRTLMNFTIASDALRYLMSEDEFDEFMKRSHEEMQKQFEDFWKKRDPTPQTAYNEAMAEYYRRCDYALENFRTLSQANGIKSDRGKIYILYGQPTKTERYLLPNAPPKEVWSYEGLDKKFIFVDESRAGNYKLFSTEKL